MTTIDAVGSTTLVGILVSTAAFLGFGHAVRSRSPNIAPRCTARHPDVIYNLNSRNPVKKNKIKDVEEGIVGEKNRTLSKEEVQYRGLPMLGWIPWVLSLSYRTMLEGIPGTGTREGGMEGLLLKVNLDAIVLIRFHMLLPLNLSVGNKETTYNNYETNSIQNKTLSNYEITTIENIFENMETSKNKLYVIVFVSWVFVVYALMLLENEWIGLLALRRTYYTEADHLENRTNELDETLLNNDLHGNFFTPLDDNRDSVLRKRKSKHFQSGSTTNRDPWIPHPEQRDTVPNVELYSVLVGGLPSTPVEDMVEDIKCNKYIEDPLLRKRQSIDWKISQATSFFDHCIPNQPGFSSSIAAVTLLPDAPLLACAWRKWYGHANLLRKRTFIENLISAKQTYDIQLTQNSLKEQRNEYNIQQAEKIKNYYCDVLGDAQFPFRENFGPEQMAVYAREYAKGASGGCCPFGCGEERIRATSGIDELYDILQETNEDLELSFKDWKESAAKASICSEEYGIPQDRDNTTDVYNSHTAHGPDEKRKGTDIANSIKKISNISSAIMNDLTSNRHRCNTCGDEKVKINSQSEMRENEGISQNIHNSCTIPSPIRSKDKENIDQLNGNLTNQCRCNTFEEKRSLVKGKLDVTFIEDNHLSNAITTPRQRTNSNFSIQSSFSVRHEEKSKEHWRDVNDIIRTASFSKGLKKADHSLANTGVWHFYPICKTGSFISRICKLCRAPKASINTYVGRDFHYNSTYAIVTFTSRQAAVAARQCLTDGRGLRSWEAMKNIPVPPLAEAASCDLKTCRGCCQPVTLTISAGQKRIRKYVSMMIMICMFLFYTAPITLAGALVEPENFYELWPGLKNMPFITNRLLSGLIPASLFALFFALCPIIFKSLSNFGGNALSANEAEHTALKFYWYFMLFTAFAGTTFATMALNALDRSLESNFSITNILVDIASTLPTQISFTWLNWIIFRTTVVLPCHYMLQLMSFVFQFLGWSCCQRCTLGGGPGGHTPYRIYIDCGVVFLCLMALAPLSPLVAPAAMMYFLFCAPLWRRNCIFIYRPTFDTGGARWPFLLDVFISSILIAQILLATLMGFKKAFGPCILVLFPVIPVLLYRNESRKCYLRSYLDAALRQTSLLDGWDNSIPSSIDTRENQRRFLVDAHKAAYVPICIAGSTSNELTVEPAVVVPLKTDEKDERADETSYENSAYTMSPISRTQSVQSVASPTVNQPGATFRRYNTCFDDTLC